MNQRVTTSLLLAIATSACTNMSGLGGDSKFKCPVPDEMPCMSMSEVDASYRAGALPGHHRAPPGADQGTKGAAGGGDDPSSASATQEAAVPLAPPPAGASQPAAQPVPRWLPQRERSNTGRRQAVADREPVPSSALAIGAIGAIRTEPTIIRIWIAPWEDADGDLNDQGYVYLQIDAGRWLIEHNREQIRRSFAPAQAAAAPARPARPVGAAGSGGSPGNPPGNAPAARPTASSAGTDAPPAGSAGVGAASGSMAAAGGSAAGTTGAGR